MLKEARIQAFKELPGSTDFNQIPGRLCQVTGSAQFLPEIEKSKIKDPIS
jgi:hypothetical protein